MRDVVEGLQSPSKLELLASHVTKVSNSPVSTIYQKKDVQIYTSVLMRLVTFLNAQRHSSPQTGLKFLAFYERQNCGGRFYCPLPHMLGALSATVPWLQGLPEQRSVQRSSAVDVPGKASNRNPRHLGNTKKEY